MMQKRFFRVATREFLICQGCALAFGLILYIYGHLEPLRYVLFFSFIYANLNWININLFFFLFKLNWQEKRHWNVRFVIKSITAFTLGLLTGFEIGNRLISLWLGRDFIPFFSKWHLYMTIMNIVLSTLVVVGVSLYHNLKYLLDRREREYMELENLQIKTRLAALQAKVNPHFLFNTLNVILDLAIKAPEKIETVVLNLSDIYRTTLGHSDNAWSTLGNEVELISKYLEIEKIRLGKRLNFYIECDSALMQVPVPPLLLEPLVENSVIHGIAAKKEGGTINLSIQSKNDHLEIVIADDGVGISEVHDNQGFGLYSVRERLHLIYGKRASFSIVPIPGGGTRILLEVPIEP